MVVYVLSFHNRFKSSKPALTNMYLASFLGTMDTYHYIHCYPVSYLLLVTVG